MRVKKETCWDKSDSSCDLLHVDRSMLIVTIVIVFICQLCYAISSSYQGSRISRLCILGPDED